MRLRECEYTNEAQTLVVWAFSKFAIIQRTIICEKSIDTLWWNGNRILQNSEIQKSLLKEKLQHDHITV